MRASPVTDILDWIDPSERERQPPLCLRWETRGIWKALETLLPCSEEEAAIATDIVLNALAGRPETSYSRDRSMYLRGNAPSRLHTYRRIVPVIDEMEQKGWILHDRRSPSPRGCGWQSAVAPKPELIDAVKAAIAIRGKPLPIRPAKPIILRAADGSVLPLPKTRRIERMTGVLDDYNRAILKATLTGCPPACLRRVFNVAPDLSRGGRFYAIGGAWQTMSEEERLQILIGGEAAIEIDIRTLHPAMLYEEAGLRLEGDAYDVGDWPRDLTKVAMLVLVNAADADQAAHSIARKEAMSLYTTPGTEDAEYAARRLIREIRQRHQKIQHAFCSDAGARLMRRDSDIAESVLKGMMKAGEICLPVHDSFIVREGAAGVLEEVLRQAVCAAGLHDIELTTKVAEKGVGGASDHGGAWGFPRNVLTYPSLSCSLLSSSLGDSESSSSEGSPTVQERHPGAERSEAPENPPQADVFPKPSLASVGDVRHAIQDPAVAAIASGTSTMATVAPSLSSDDPRDPRQHPGRSPSPTDTAVALEDPHSSHNTSGSAAFTSSLETPFHVDSRTPQAMPTSTPSRRLPLPVFRPSQSSAVAIVPSQALEVAASSPQVATTRHDMNASVALEDLSSSQDAAEPNNQPSNSASPSSGDPQAPQTKSGFRFSHRLADGTMIDRWSPGVDVSPAALAGRPWTLRVTRPGERPVVSRHPDQASCDAAYSRIVGAEMPTLKWHGPWDPALDEDSNYKAKVAWAMDLYGMKPRREVRPPSVEVGEILRAFPGSRIREVSVRRP